MVINVIVALISVVATSAQTTPQSAKGCGRALDRTFGNEWSATIKKISSLDDQTLILAAERLVHSYRSTSADERARSTNGFLTAYPHLLDPVTRINYDLLRTIDLGLNSDEVGLLAVAVSKVDRSERATLIERALNADFTEYVRYTKSVIERSEYRSALVDLLQNGTDEDTLIRNVRLQNDILGGDAPLPQFNRKDLKRFIKMISRKETSPAFINALSQLVEGVIIEINTFGRARPDFAEFSFTVRGNHLDTVVSADSLRRNAAHYFQNSARTKSPPHVLRALVNTFGNIEPLPMPPIEMRRQIARALDSLGK